MFALRFPMLALAILSSFFAIGSLAQQPELSKIQIVAAGEIGHRWERQILEHVRENLWIQTDIHRIDAVTNGVVSQMPSFCLDTPATSNTVTVCIVDGPVPECGANVGAFDLYPEKQCGVVWASCLKPVAEAGDADADGVWLARIQKQTGFVAARLLGHHECPFWLCVMHTDASMDDLDSKARGLCPPCLDEMRSRLGLPD